jgi:hypothetical protein
MKLFTTDLKNQPGELAHVCETLAQRGVNLELSGVTAGDHGLVYFIASDEAAAREALHAANIGFESTRRCGSSAPTSQAKPPRSPANSPTQKSTSLGCCRPRSALAR